MLAEDGIEFVCYYIDDGFTGVDSDRDDFQRLLTDIHNGKVNCVLVKDLSRLSRNDWECKYYLQMLFVKMNVRFISLELPKLDSFKRPEGVYELDVSFQSMYNENHCRSEEHTSELQSRFDLVCRLLLEINKCSRHK